MFGIVQVQGGHVKETRYTSGMLTVIDRPGPAADGALAGH
jgi:hypothetical protein